MASNDIILQLARHYALAVGHLLGGAVLFLVILAVAIYVGTFADWMYEGRTVDPFVKYILLWVKRFAVLLDGVLFLAVGSKAVQAVWKS